MILYIFSMWHFVLSVSCALNQCLVALDYLIFSLIPCSQLDSQIIEFTHFVVYSLMYLIDVTYFFLMFIFQTLISWIVQLEQVILLHVLMTSELFWCKCCRQKKAPVEILNTTKNCKSVRLNQPLSILRSVYLMGWLRYVIKFLFHIYLFWTILSLFRISFYMNYV